ncbi:diacylglycerol o-acyltransferase, putative [Perkinsus marinus ATCC 50983]|uniref:diacylglycerol O-acyltransferase n=1 Tax=Perkinsus marinus (strain ATCC 50983 / TXsc) TaxID=423536 RepID=C5LH48_PERM5|nr:diacylglycerol o-acyltransferase, putative [Perkinsus marinus ATCC 50983]EER03857.1 diacylglycerol o-acyltransferase, putative [Perkinsus marinus ATCC 50983]|eukprot:XP_002772041.1 diacylglycerol o-acyltransferase, putative [Perkinsus marinus ATCC 50983]
MCHPQAFYSIPHDTCKLAASICFKVPLMRETYLWCGMIDAGRPTCMTALDQGYSLTIVVGGTREQLIPYSPTHDTILCKNRKGFIKLARDAGRIPIVPCYSFGESIAYETSDFLLSFRRWLQRRFGVGWAVAKTWNPRRLKDFVLVVGSPITWEEQDTVETIHAKYVAAVRDLFYEHRANYAEYANRELLIE